MVDAGLNVVCEVTLNESHWMDVDLGLLSQRDSRLTEEFDTFLEEWQKLYKVLPEFKVVVADMQTFLADLQIWLEQVEARHSFLAGAGSFGDWSSISPGNWDNQLFRRFDALHERLEALSAQH